MLDYCVYLLYRAALAIIAVLPLSVIFFLGKLLGFLGWIALPNYRGLARGNLQIAFFGEKSARQISCLVRKHFQRLGANLLSGIKLNGMPSERVAGLIATEGLDEVHRELRNGRPVVIALSHLGNWELFAQILPHYFGYARLSTVYQKLGNRFLDEFVRRQRARFGVELFDRSEGFQKAIQVLRGGGMIGILSDQHAGDHGLWTPFFQRLASTSPLPGLLAKRTGAALVAASLYTDGPARWRMVFTSRFDAPNDSVQSLTAKTNVVIEQQIRRAPEDWFWVHNRWKTPKPNLLLINYKRGLYVPPQTPGNELRPFRILIRASSWLGDSIISMPAVHAIKAGRPDAHITIVAPEKIAAVWKLWPDVNEILPMGPSLFSTAKLIREQPAFDVAILFPNSTRSALEIWLGGVPRRVGYRGHHRRWLLNQIVPERMRLGPLEHQAVHYLQIARALGSDAEIAEVTSEMRARSNAPTLQKVGLCPGAEYGPAKRWLPERFAEAAATIATQMPVQWILFGTKNDAVNGNQIAGSLGNSCINRIGQTTLDQLIEELRECRLLLTNDTGTMHLATLLGVPVVAVFGSTDPRLTGPLGRGHRVIRHQVECSPCFLRECPIDFRCMKAITVEEVVAVATALLSTAAVPR
jgi:lipopolysaccharide heptosyltransferase II